MNEPCVTVPERVSALCDGQLTGDEFLQAMADLHSDPHAIATWRAYHLVGDALRDREVLPVVRDFVFWEKLEGRLALEPGLASLADDEGGVPTADPMHVGALRHRAGVPGANAPVFGWKMLTGVFSTVLFGVVGVALWGQNAVQPQAQAVVPSAAGVATTQFVVKQVDAGLMVRDPQLDELMAAHQQLGGHSAFQVPTGFLRNATFEGAAR